MRIAKTLDDLPLGTPIEVDDAYARYKGFVYKEGNSGDEKMRQCGNGETGKCGTVQVGAWGNGKGGQWEEGPMSKRNMGKWGTLERENDRGKRWNGEIWP